MIIAIDQPDRALERACAALREGSIVALPTDTVYGFAVDGTDMDAVNRLVKLKGRESKPFTLFVEKKQLDRYVYITNQRIIGRFMPGPLTVILRKKENIDLPYVRDTIGVRIPDTPLVLNLLETYEHPLAVTSANRSDERPLTSPYEIVERFTDVPVIIDGGTLRSEPSTVLDCVITPPVIKRKGALPIQSIENAYGGPVRIDTSIRFNLLFVCTGNSCRSPMAEAILRTMVNPAQCEIKSAGTMLHAGMPAAENAQIVVKEHGGSLADHRSQPVTPALIMWADAIFAAAQKHLTYVRQLVPAAHNKTMLLMAYEAQTHARDIADPVGQDLTAYRATARQMLPVLRMIARDIKKRYQGDA